MQSRQFASPETKNFPIFALVKVLIVASVLATSSLSFAQDNNKAKTKGRIFGGIIGGLLGSTIGEGGERVAGAGAGALLGALIGGEIAEKFSEEDEREYGNTMNRALTSDYHTNHYVWQGNTHRGSVRFVRHGQVGDMYCREYYSETYNYNGFRTVRTGYVCRYNTGVWYPQTTNPWEARFQDNQRNGRDRRYDPTPREIELARRYCYERTRTQIGFERCMRDQLGGRY